MTHERFYTRKLRKLNEQLRSRIDFQGESNGFKVVQIMLDNANTMIEGTNFDLQKRKLINKNIRSIEKLFYPMIKV